MILMGVVCLVLIYFELKIGTHVVSASLLAGNRWQPHITIICVGLNKWAIYKVWAVCGKPQHIGSAIPWS